MRQLRNYLIFLPLLILISCLWLSKRYQDQQSLIVLESNDLKTPIHLSLSADEVSQVLPHLQNSHSPVWLMEKTRTDGNVILNIMSNDWEKLRFPLKSGRLLDKNDLSKALVGQSVKTITEGDKASVFIRGHRYEVVGRLGLTDKSPLSHTVVISDQSLFTYDGEWSLNGTVHALNLGAIGQKGDNKGMERLFSLSDFNRILTISTLLFVSLSAVFWVSLLIRRKRQEYQLYHILGKSWSAIYQKELAVLSLVNVAMMAPFIVLDSMLGNGAILLVYYVMLFVIEGLSFTVWFYRGLAYAEK